MVCRRNAKCIAHQAGFISDKDYYASYVPPRPADRTGNGAMLLADELRKLFLKEMHLTPPTPQIDWIKNDPAKYTWFEDGSRFLVALVVRNEKTKTELWDFDVVVTDCTGDGMSLKTVEGESYSSWDWSDFEYFHLIEGTMPKADNEV